MRRRSCTDPPPLHALLPTPIERQHADDAYWVVDACYEVDGEALDKVLIPAAEELWLMCQDLVDRAVGREDILASLGIPTFAWDAIAASWAQRDPVLFARFDLSFDGASQPKLHECNIDVVGLLHETAIFQCRWRDRQAPRAAQFAHLAEATAAVLRRAAAGGAVQLSILGDDPDDALWQHALRSILEGIGIAATLRRHESPDTFVASIAEGAPRIIKGFRWDHLVRDRALAARLNGTASRITAPIWSLVLSSKGSLAWLWHFNRGHPNLLPASLDPRDLPAGSGYVAKPLFSIQGRGVTLHEGGATPLRAEEPRIYQQRHDLPRIGPAGRAPWTSTGAWVVEGKAVAIGMTECDSPVITDAAMRYVPHVVT